MCTRSSGRDANKVTINTEIFRVDEWRRKVDHHFEVSTDFLLSLSVSTGLRLRVREVHTSPDRIRVGVEVGVSGLM